MGSSTAFFDVPKFRSIQTRLMSVIVGVGVGMLMIVHPNHFLPTFICPIVRSCPWPTESVLSSLAFLSFLFLLPSADSIHISTSLLWCPHPVSVSVSVELNCKRERERMATPQEQLRSPLLRKYEEGCPGCMVQRQNDTVHTTPFKYFTFMGLVVLCNALPISSLFPFVYFMVRDFNIASTEDIGYYVGFVGSSFMFGRFLSSLFWGVFADKYGRKPVMYIGILSVIIFNTLFGFSVNIWMAISTRFLLGFFNGLMGVVRAYASEVCRSEYQALGLSIVGTTWGIGLIIGPAIGGYLAQPAEAFPNIFSGTLFESFPYLLPCLCISIIAVMVLVMTFWLPETIHKHPSNLKTKPLVDVEDGKEASSDQEKKDKDATLEISKKSLFKNWPVMSTISIYCIYAFHDVAYTEIFSVWAESPRSYGGLSYSSRDVGTILAITGCGILVFQLSLYPPLEKLVGGIFLTRVASIVSIPLLQSYPLISELSGSLQWAIINIASVIKNLLSVAIFTSTLIFLNNSVSQEQRASANGLSMTVQSLFKTIGPTAAGSLFSWSESRLDASFLPGVHLVFFSLNVLMAIVFLMSFKPFLPGSVNRPCELNEGRDAVISPTDPQRE